MKKLIAVTIAICAITAAAYADDNSKEEEQGVNYIPLAQYDHLSLDKQTVKSPGAGLVVQGKDVMFVGLYTRHILKEEPQCDYPDAFHSIDTLLDGRAGRHQYLVLFKSESNEPVYGGFNTFQSALMYGYEFVSTEHTSFIFGGGIAVSDFGIDMPNGEPWPVIPVPLIRYKYDGSWLYTSFDFITGPNLNMVVGPKSQFRLTVDTRMDEFRDERDILFECTLGYRFFPVDHEMGDFAGVAVGFKNDNYGAFELNERYADFTCDDDETESLEIHYYAVFATLDITLLKISGGYAFGGRELCRKEEKRDLGDGYFVSIQGLYQF